MVLRELVLSEIDEDQEEAKEEKEQKQQPSSIEQVKEVKEVQKIEEVKKIMEIPEIQEIEEIEEFEEPPMPRMEARERPKLCIDTNGASNDAASPRYQRRSEMIKMKARQQQQRERSNKNKNAGEYVERRGASALEPSVRRKSAPSSQKQRVKQRSHRQDRHQHERQRQPQYTGRSNHADPPTNLVKKSMKQGRRSKFERERVVMNQQQQHRHHHHHQQHKFPQPHPQQFPAAMKQSISNKHHHRHHHQQQQLEPWPLTNHMAAAPPRMTNGMERRDDSFSEFYDAMPYDDVHQHPQSSSSGSHNEVFHVISSRRGRGMNQAAMMDEREDPRIMSLDYALD